MTDTELAANLYQAELIACKVASKHSRYRYHLEDMKAVARAACWRVTLTYDPARNPKFWGVAYKRVYGAVIDYLRAAKVVFREDKRCSYNAHGLPGWDMVRIDKARLPHVAPDQYWRVVAREEGVRT